MSLRRFTTLSGIDGYEVIDADGRTVALRQSERSANGVAHSLNKAASQGPQELSNLLTHGYAVDHRDRRWTA